MQCTADLLPADIVGTNVYNQREQRFEFRPGPIFANVVLVDEINRASPKTQSGLLECMQERHVTVDVHTHELARPFLVLATQNPIEYEGTYPLPEAQVDRFMVRVSLGYPDAAPRRRCSPATRRATACSTLEPVASPAERPRRPGRGGAACTRPTALRDYVVALLGRTRADPRVELGASPRAGLMLLRAAKARALLRGPRPRAARRRPGARAARPRPPPAARPRGGGRAGRGRAPPRDRRRHRRRPRRCDAGHGRNAPVAMRPALAAVALGLVLALAGGAFDAEPLLRRGHRLRRAGRGVGRVGRAGRARGACASARSEPSASSRTSRCRCA